MLEATRREANELYTLFRILEQGYLNQGDAEGNAQGQTPVVAVLRQEHDGERRYLIESSDVHVIGQQIDERFPREDFAAAADMLQEVLHQEGQTLDISPIEPFLDALQLFDMQAHTEDRTNLHVQLWSLDGGPVIGIRIQSRMAGYMPLLDGGRTANIKYEQSGVRFSHPAVNKINWSDDEENLAEIPRRWLYIERLGGILKYADVADKVFKSNLLMIDTNLPRIIASMLRNLHLDDATKMEEHITLLEEQNPLKVKDELVKKHGIYRHKVTELLLACAWGMRPAKQWNGRETAIGGYVFVDGKGQLLLFDRAHEQIFGDYLVAHTRLEKAVPTEAHYGSLERENGAYYLKLNLKIGFSKR